MGRPTGPQSAAQRQRPTHRRPATRATICGPRRPTPTERVTARAPRRHRPTQCGVRQQATGRRSSRPARPASGKWRENTVAGTSIGRRVGAVDRNTLTYTLGGPDASSFGIIATSGQLQTKAPLDYESKSSYTVTVTATDPSNAKDVITITITVTNVDETPVVTAGPSIKYAENGIGTVATYAATDPEGTAITWSLSGVDSGPFSISSAGALTFNTPPDYEDPADADMDNVYLVTVEASDGTVTGALEVTVTVTDEIETSELPSTETGGWSVKENTVAETNIGSPVVVMDDADDTLTYTLGGPDAASFGIIASSGQLQTKAPLDYETKASYSVEVTAKPPSGVSETIPVTIMVEDVSLGEVGDTL